MFTYLDFQHTVVTLTSQVHIEKGDTNCISHTNIKFNRTVITNYLNMIRHCWLNLMKQNSIVILHCQSKTYCALPRYNSRDLTQFKVLLFFPGEPYQNRFVLKKVEKPNLNFWQLENI